MARNQHNWSEATKSAVIAAVEAGMTDADAGAMYGVPARTVTSWMAGEGVDLNAIQHKVAAEKTALADKLEALAHAIVDKAAGKIDAATLPGSMTALGIAVDKRQLLLNKPTSIVDNPKSIEERDKKALEILERGKLRMVNGGAE